MSLAKFPQSLNGKFNVFIANIIRRMITGERHSIRDPKLIHITRMLAKQHQQFQPDNIMTLLQLRFPFFVTLFEKLGLEVRDEWRRKNKHVEIACALGDHHFLVHAIFWCNNGCLP